MNFVYNIVALLFQPGKNISTGNSFLCSQSKSISFIFFLSSTYTKNEKHVIN